MPGSAGASEVYTLISAAGISGGGFSLAPSSVDALPPGVKETLGVTGTAVTLTVTSAPTGTGGNFYWQGGAGQSWYANISSGAATNWTLGSGGGSDAGFTPAAWNTVNFSAGNVSASPLVTTLDQNFAITGLNFNMGAGAVTINPSGYAPGSSAVLTGFNGALTIGAGGIVMAAGAATPDIINANVTLGASQTWQVADAASDLAVNGDVSGAFSITKSGGGALTLSGYNTFTGGVAVSSGTLNINNGGGSAALADSVLGTGALTLATGVTLVSLC
jgi:autotransporter-associated beta strand protein